MSVKDHSDDISTPHGDVESMLRDSIWAQNLDSVALDHVRSQITEREVGPGDYVCHQGYPADHWIGVIQGLVKLSVLSPEGKAITLTGVNAGGWFGEGSLLKDEPRRYDGIAVGQTRVALMPRATFTWLLDNSIAFNRFLLRQLNERLGLFISMVSFDRMLRPEARVARCLATLFNSYLYPNGSLSLKVSQEDVAQLCGMSRQRANQALRELEANGLLKVEYGRINIQDLEALRDYGE
ncbi:cyclic nucleotide-binding protein [Alcanivorax xiamenensis]|uniref:Cyclic nucleotide-binding protein n=1 Tax=Alcanivorax xiamenensis TaxID=1177156 RepID=A0ABQ6Y3Q7_9GAMM|nr:MULTISPECIES: Crp/Fnr family transcriptional regulator [Alcanivorax]KAF0803617.1 cyclic nucleotide-binding protein [Alcanivorax xiamenensis]